MYYLKIISLEGCPYSEAAEKLVSSNKIDSEIIKVTQNEKKKFKTNEIQTFPQIYLKKKHSNGDVLIGGYSKLKEYFDKIMEEPSNSKFDSLKLKILNDNKNLSEKSALRMIELLSKNY